MQYRRHVQRYPVTVGGKLFASLIIIVGLAVVAVPTSLLSAELMRNRDEGEDSQG